MLTTITTILTVILDANSFMFHLKKKVYYTTTSYKNTVNIPCSVCLTASVLLDTCNMLTHLASISPHSGIINDRCLINKLTAAVV